MDEIILIGAGGHARACIDVIELSRQFKVAGLIAKEKTNIGMVIKLVRIKASNNCDGCA